MSLLQEKFQTVAPEPPASSRQWTSDKNARRTTNAPGMLNALPPGTNIDDQALIDSPRPVRTMGGETDVTRDFTREGLTNGYTRRNVKPTDDAYTSEHADTFYGDAKVDGETGFVERGNVLDRI